MQVSVQYACTTIWPTGHATTGTSERKDHASGYTTPNGAMLASVLCCAFLATADSTASVRSRCSNDEDCSLNASFNQSLNCLA